MIDTEKMRKNFADTNRGKTHYEGCEYVHPYCAIEALCREVERLRKKEVRRVGLGWLPAPDRMPEELAPARMVELHGWESDPLPAMQVAWEVVSKYRPLYSDSGEVLCSSEGLEEWARFVATSSEGVTIQHEYRPMAVKSKESWMQSGKIGTAPESHRKPGDWRDSLMKVMR